MKSFSSILLFFACIQLHFESGAMAADNLLVEAESFSDRGGWVLDTQFIEKHGLSLFVGAWFGAPSQRCDDQSEIPRPPESTRSLFERKTGWRSGIRRGLRAKFQISVDGKRLETLLGTQGKDWFWQPAGTVKIANANVTLGIHDLTGFDGRCDAHSFSQRMNPEFRPMIQPCFPNGGVSGALA